ncbi:putative adenylosuccinate synthetase [Curtobacterium phage Parvaparticeps]|nr:putative adenylosuccinate synthetase [Curtobacterium phage Parvaparticeps]
MQKVVIVAGAQYGSEGKGHVTHQILQRLRHDEPISGLINVRVAGPNAGHTVYDRAGQKFALRSVPVGAVVPGVVLYVAPGSEIDPDVLYKEILELRAAGHEVPLYVSPEATILRPKHKYAEQEADLTGRVGSTGKGIGAARSDRLMRTAERVIDAPDVLSQLAQFDVGLADPESLYEGDEFGNALMDQTIVIEGTQGFGLGLHTKNYPQVTSSDARAIDFLGMAGISPWRAGTEVVVYLAARVYPIRVAGNSGPMEGETSWEELGLPEEYTTVTQKVRRVGQWDADLIAEAVQANGGGVVRLALTMADQKFPGLRGLNSRKPLEVQQFSLDGSHEVGQWIREVEQAAGAQVHMVTTSPVDAIWTRGL